MPADTTTGPDTRQAAGAAQDCDHAQNRPGARYCAHCGAPLTSTDTAPPRRRTDRVRARQARAAWAGALRLRPRAAATLALVLALTAAAVAALYIVQARWYSPAEAARAFGEALEHGDGPAAAAMLGVDPDHHPLLAPGALDAGYTPVTDWEVTGTAYDTAGTWEAGRDGISSRWTTDYTHRPDMDHATVTVAYRLDGQDRTADLHATRETTGWARAWTLDPGPLASTLTPTGRTAPLTLAAATIPDTTTEPEAADDSGGGALLALPGIYTLTAPAGGMWTAATDTVAVPLGADAHAFALGALRPEAEADAEAAVRSHLDACATAGGMPGGPCGFRDDSGWSLALPNSAIWQITHYPDIAITPEAAGRDGITISTITPGAATTEYETILGETRTITAEVHANGTATYTSGELAFTARACDTGEHYC